ncbi:MAG: hypothetical protein EBU90_30240 [Proteobacteria bacterium]|nr:hypothetical protein [Pseudomonadota bacterium]
MGIIDSELQYNWRMRTKPTKITITQEGEVLQEYSFTLAWDADMLQWIHVFRCILAAQSFDDETINEYFDKYQE